jgi:mono/diheme cytochrome c family protein
MVRLATIWPRFVLRLLAPALLLGATGCRQEMASQPRYRPLDESRFFPDGSSARLPVPGTVARGSEQATGFRAPDNNDWARASLVVGHGSQSPLGALGATQGWMFYTEVFPLPITEKVLQRGQERFNIYCAVCHDRSGSGRGMIVQRGFTKPPSFHTDLSRGLKLRGINVKLIDAPVGYYFEVIRRGFGAMPDYASQVAPADRWAITAYIRVLQFSQRAGLSEVRDAKERQRLLTTRGDKP